MKSQKSTMIILLHRNSRYGKFQAQGCAAMDTRLRQGDMI